MHWGSATPAVSVRKRLNRDINYYYYYYLDLYAIEGFLPCGLLQCSNSCWLQGRRFGGDLAPWEDWILGRIRPSWDVPSLRGQAEGSSLFPSLG